MEAVCKSRLVRNETAGCFLDSMSKVMKAAPFCLRLIDPIYESVTKTSEALFSSGTAHRLPQTMRRARAFFHAFVENFPNYIQTFGTCRRNTWEKSTRQKYTRGTLATTMKSHPPSRHTNTLEIHLNRYPILVFRPLR